MAKETEFQETELKLRCAIESLPALTQLLDSIAKPKGGRQLNNTYYDTADTALAQAKAALRIRESHGQYEQTLKTRGKSVAGLQLRGEWNWPIATAQLDASLLQQPEIKTHLPESLIVTDLHSIFSTNFERHTWLYKQDGTTIEVAVDSGQVIAGSLKQPLCECELELVAGRVDLLWQLAQTLGEQAPLWISDISKAERGYLLANLSPSWKKWQPQQQNTELMLQLEYALVHWQRALEAVIWDDEKTHIATLMSVIGQVAELAEQLSCSGLVSAVAPWNEMRLSDLDVDSKNNKNLALSLQKAAFSFYQLSKEKSK